MVLMEQHFDVSAYYRLAATGGLPAARVELLNGRIIKMSPMRPLQGGIVDRLSRWFMLSAAGRWHVSTQRPLRLADDSKPEPDLLVVKPRRDDYLGSHARPEDVFWLVEVADSSLDYDREEKLPAYGRAGIAEVWIVNLTNARIAVYREPHFTGYAAKQVHLAGDQMSPLAFPDLVIRVAGLLAR